MPVRLVVVLRLSLKKAPAERAIQDQGLPIYRGIGAGALEHIGNHRVGFTSNMLLENVMEIRNFR